MSKPVYLWDREDGQGQPKAISKTRPAPGPGTVYVVVPMDGPGKAVDRARMTFAMSKVDIAGMNHTQAGPYMDARAAVKPRDEE